MIHSRLGCSTISFRHLSLELALGWVGALGFAEVDLGALPRVCDHVPYVLDRDALDTVADTVRASGFVFVRSTVTSATSTVRWTPTAAPPATVTSRCSLR
jgi:sugar phosphate isomerase/epimerase